MSGSGSLWDHHKHSIAVKRVDHSLLILFLFRFLCCDSTVLSQTSALLWAIRAAIRSGLDPAGTTHQWPVAPSWLLPSSLLWALRARKALLFPLGILGQEFSTLMVCLSSTKLPWLQPYLWTWGEQQDSWSQAQKLAWTSERYNWGWVNIRRKINCFSHHPKCQKGQLGKNIIASGLWKTCAQSLSIKGIGK